MRITLQPAFVLHTRPLNETSVILELLTLDYGRVSLVARGVRTLRSRLRGLLRAFMPLMVSWSGKTELMTLSAAEPVGAATQFCGANLLSGLYVNELLVRLLPKFDSHPSLFVLYQKTLQQLSEQASPEICLRIFEKTLLAELGYGLVLDREAETDTAITAEKQYTFIAGQGLIPVQQPTPATPVFQGSSLLAFHHEKLIHPSDLLAAKRLTRLALSALLGDKPIKSRELFHKNIMIKRYKLID